VDGWTDWEMACAIFKESMRKIGIEVTVRAMDYPSWSDTVNRGDFDFKPMQTDAWTPTGVWDFYRTVFDSRVPEWPMLEGKCSGYHNPEVNRLLDEIAATSMTEEEKLKELYGKLTTIICRDMPVIPAWSWGGIGIYSTRYWTGWPTEDNPYPPAEPGWSYENLLTLIHLKPVGAIVVTPTIPPELEELPERFASLETTVGEISSGISSLSASIENLGSSVDQLNTTLMSVIALQIITLIVALVAVVRAGRRE